MTSVPLGYLRIADHLLQGDITFSPEISPEARQRTAINRYYYAINRLGDYYLAEYLKDPKYCQIAKKYHKTIKDCLKALGDPKMQKVIQRIGQLYAKREAADYDNSYTSIGSDSAIAKRFAWQVKEIFDELLKV